METQNPNSVGSTPVVEDNPGTKYPFWSISLSDAELSSIITTIDQLKGILPAMPDLTTIERKRMSKLGSKTRGFADAAIEAAKTDPTVLPGSMPLATLLAQDDLFRDLSLVQTHVSNLKAKLDDALLLVGNWLYGATRTVYAVLKTDAAKAKLQEQKALMKQRFTYTVNKDKGKSQTTKETTGQA